MRSVQGISSKHDSTMQVTCELVSCETVLLIPGKVVVKCCCTRKVVASQCELAGRALTTPATAHNLAKAGRGMASCRLAQLTECWRFMRKACDVCGGLRLCAWQCSGLLRAECLPLAF